MRTNASLSLTAVLVTCVATPALSAQHAQGTQRPWYFQGGIDTDGWQRMNAVAVVRVTGSPHTPENPNDARRDWPVAVVSTYEGGPSPQRLRVRGSWGVPDGWLEHPGTYLVLAAMPKDGKDAPLYADSDPSLLDPAPDGHARVYWALPFSGTPPRSGGTKEEWFGRALLAALEGNPRIYEAGLSEFLRGLGRNDRSGRRGGGLVGLQPYGGTKHIGLWSPGGFSHGLVQWAARQGPRERLFAGLALENLGVAGSSAYYNRSLWEYASTDADPPDWHHGPYPMGYASPLTDEELPLADAELPTTEEWVSTIVRLKNPKAQELLLSCRSEGEREIGLDHLRRLSALLDSPLPRVRWLLCDYYWGRLDLTTMPEAEAEQYKPIERSEENRAGPPDYPRLDEHVLRWKQYFR